MKDKLRFFISKKFFLHTGIMIVILVVGFYALSSWLNSYTNHGQKQEVPDFVGLDFDAAKLIAEKNNLNLKVYDTLFVETVSPGAIIDHTPKKGKYVKTNRTIYVTVNSKEEIMVLMPKAFDVSFRQAKHILESSGLQIGRIEYKPDIADNYVFEQKYKKENIKPGTKIPKGSKISLVVGKGSLDTKIMVPSIIGETYENAIIILDSLGVNYNPIFAEAEYKNKEDSLKTIVWKQLPMASETNLMMLSQTLDFWVQPQDSITTPSN